MKTEAPPSIRLSAWILIQALFFIQILSPFVWAMRAPQRGDDQAGVEEIRRSLQGPPLLTAGTEERLTLTREISAELSPEAAADTANKVWNLSFSGGRTVTGTAALLSDGDWATFARAGYLYARQQLAKLRKADPALSRFTFVLARDTKATGGDGLVAQAAGMLTAAREKGLELSFKMVGRDGVLPTPFAAALVRMLGTHGGVIVTASHNPADQNGFKYLTAAREPPEAPVQGGTVLAAGEMGQIVQGVNHWLDEGKKGPGKWSRFLAKMRNKLDQPAGSFSVEVESLEPEKVIDVAVKEQRQAMGLSDPEVFERFQNKAGRVRVLVDPNGGAAAGFYAEAIRRFGFRVVEINGQKGVFAHGLEPVGEAMAQAKQAMLDERALVAVVLDPDADRGNTLLLRRPHDGRENSAVEPAPWDVAAMNLAIRLSMVHTQRMARPTAFQGFQVGKGDVVVLHDFPDGRQRAIAGRFGAEISNVETGEVNVLTRMRQLQKEGWTVLMGAEQANGGTVLPWETSRSGFSSLLLQATALAEPSMLTPWFQAVGRLVPTYFNLADLLDTLPGEKTAPASILELHVATRVSEKLGRDRVPPEAVIAFKQKVLDGIAQLLPQKAKEAPQAEVILYSETVSTLPALSQNGKFSVPQKTWKEYGMGGMRIIIRYPSGAEVVYWMRGSKTEGGMRIAVEVRRSPQASELADVRMEEFRQMAEQITQEKEWWKKVAAAGAEGIPVIEAEAAKNLVILTPDTATVGVQALARLRGSSGAQAVQFAVIVNDRAQAREVSQLLERHQVQLSNPPVVLSEKRWSREQGIAYLRSKAWNKGLDPQIIETRDQLRALGRLLVPKSYWDEWDRQLAQQAGLETQM